MNNYEVAMKIQKLIVLSMILARFNCLQGQTDLNGDFLKLLGGTKKPAVIEKKEKEAALEPDTISCEDTDTADVSLHLLKILTNQTPDFENEKENPEQKFYKGEIERLGIEYLDAIEYDNPTIQMPSISEKQLLVLDRMNFKKYGWLIEQKYEAPWYMKFINEKVGHGIFAATDFEDGDFIGEYTGIIYDERSFKALIPFDSNYAWSIRAPSNYKIQNVRFYVDAKKASNFTRFINHSYESNVRPVTIYAKDGWHMIYVACKSIKKDEQLLVNYGEGYWHGRIPEVL